MRMNTPSTVAYSGNVASDAAERVTWLLRTYYDVREGYDAYSTGQGVEDDALRLGSRPPTRSSNAASSRCANNGERLLWYHATRRYRDARRVVLEVSVRRGCSSADTACLRRWAGFTLHVALTEPDPGAYLQLVLSCPQFAGRGCLDGGGHLDARGLAVEQRADDPASVGGHCIVGLTTPITPPS
jgi:hypothetical protein